MTASEERPLIAHVVYRFDIGGLENGVVNLLNRMPSERFRHAVVALTDVTEFRSRVARDDVEFVSLHKTPGHGVKLLPRILRLFRRMRPTIVHTRNLAALETSAGAWFARVPIRIHGEHGRDVGDLDGSNRKYRVVRRAYRPFVTHYVALSRDLERYLTAAVGVPPSRITRIINGVDTDAFHPAPVRKPPAAWPFDGTASLVFGTVGRLQPVKNQTLLARAFVRLIEMAPDLRGSARLVIVGEGPLRSDIERILEAGNATRLAWLAGSRDDVQDIMRSLDVFVLPSLAEGISNTILEAMASGLPVVAARVGGNAELVDDGATGTLVPVADVEALARAMLAYATDPGLVRRQGTAGRARAESCFSLDAMVGQYTALYERLVAPYREVARRCVDSGTSRAVSGSH
ncbi:MAG: TIGR03088 family PEP-CTERM/XrtA system glycosyltransferase [Deltaproteobacteria bacterium]|jgi:sugar transferase (PEP-CTERM/EpsH1 system associated)